LFNDLQEVPDGSRDSLTRKFTKQISAADTFRPIVSDRELNSYSIDVLHQHISHYRIYSTNNLILGPGKLGLNIGYQKNIRREFSHPEYPSVPGLFLDLRSFTYDIKYSLPAFMGWETSFGLNGMYQVNSNKGTEFIIPDYRLFDIGPFVLFTRSFNKLDISGGIRFDSRFYNNEEMFVKTDPSTGFEIRVNSTDTLMAENIFHKSDHTFSGISASFGAAYNFSKNFFLKANVARGFRSPNIAEISANGVHPGTLIYQIGNDSFKPEFSLQEDIELSYRSDHISGEVDVFNNNISNYIFNRKLLDQNGMDSIIIRGNQTFRFQQSKAQLFGGEANIDIHPYDWLHFENSISVIYGLSKDDYSRYLPLIPPLHTNTELKAAFKNVSRRLSNFYIRAGIEYYGKQNRVYTAYNTETPTPGYTLVNAGIGADVVNKNKKTVVSINIMAKNITGLAYQSHLSRLKYFEEFPDNPSGRKGIYEMGRNVSFKFTFPMDFR
jgi:iron complex outermembrane receptor protein